MKKFFLIFAAISALCIGNFAQKKTAFDPCLSKDPKVRATSKKPCPSAPASKKNKPVDPPKGTDDGETSDAGNDSDDSASNSKTNKKTNPPAKNNTPKKGDDVDGLFFITIIHNGEKTELAYTQFETYGGLANIENEHSRRLMLSYGASNSAKNDESFSFQGMIPGAEKGAYLFGKDVTFTFNSSRFPNVQLFICTDGGYEISAMPLKGGFVEGTFTANCTGEVHNDGTSEKYTMSGRFKLLRML